MINIKIKQKHDHILLGSTRVGGIYEDKWEGVVSESETEREQPFKVLFSFEEDTCALIF